MVTPHYPPNPQPVGTWVREVGSRLAGRGHEVVVHTRNRDPQGKKLPPREETDDLTVRRYPATIHLGDQLLLFKPKIEEGHVLLHGYACVTNDRILDTYDGGPVVYHLHHGVEPPSASLLSSAFQAVYHPLVASHALKQADGVLTSTDQDHDRLVKMGVGPDRIRTAPYGVDEARIKEGFADPAPGKPHGTYVLFPGPLERSRRPMDVLEAVAGLADGGAVFAGPDGPAAAWLEQRAQDLGLTDRVALVPDPDEETRLGLVRAARAVVLPHEPAFPVAALEAWTQARPVVAARTDGVPWVVDGGRTGLLYPRGDVGALRGHLRRLVEDESAAEAMGKRGLDALDRFTWARVTRDVEAFLKEVGG